VKRAKSFMLDPLDLNAGISMAKAMHLDRAKDRGSTVGADLDEVYKSVKWRPI
jgi:hypothetical protein